MRVLLIFNRLLAVISYLCILGLLLVLEERHSQNLSSVYDEEGTSTVPVGGIGWGWVGGGGGGGGGARGERPRG